MSEIMKTMAEMLLGELERTPSSEAAHAALLLANVAWNRAIRAKEGLAPYNKVLKEFEKSNPNFWSELRSSNTEEMIAELVLYKQQNHADDCRRVTVCGIRNGNIHVEWTEK